MKKTIFVLLAFLHLFTVVGFSMNLHFCMKKTSVSIAGIEINKSCKCKHDEKKHSKKCCNNKNVKVKADYSKDKTISKTVSLNPSYSKNSNSINSFVFIFNPQNSKSLFITNKGSPPKHSPPLFLLNSVFLI